MTNLNIAQLNHTVTQMTSLQIAELVGKRHDNVKRTVETLVNSEVIARPQIEDMQNVVNNRLYTTQVYIFTGEQGKLDSITVVAQLCPEFTAALVKRWYELEQQQFKIPQTMHEALQLAADQAKQLELQAPKVNFYDKLADRKTLLTATQVGNQFKNAISAKKLNKLLEEFDVYNKVIKRSRTFKKWFIDQGLGEMKITQDGHAQALFTPRGEQWIVQQFTSEGII